MTKTTYHLQSNLNQVLAKIGLSYREKTKKAVAEWFIDKFTTGAKFWTQNHRTRGIDPRRVTLHPLKDVGERRNNAEVDRVWEVTPGIFAPPITYVLSGKRGLVNKKHVDDFLDVLRWSKQLGVDTSDGRDVKQRAVGVFAASAFNPKEMVSVQKICERARNEEEVREMLDRMWKQQEKGEERRSEK